MPGDHEALKRAMRAARNQAGYESDSSLALDAGVHLQTLQNWMYGKTTPRPSELSKVARVLDRPMDYFMAIYEGREPEPKLLEDAVGELTAVVRELVAEIREERARGQDAAAAMLRAAAVLGSHPKNGEGPASTAPRVPHGTKG
jgi:transcriptional regulator with XRE-family HTH domain